MKPDEQVPTKAFALRPSSVAFASLSAVFVLALGVGLAYGLPLALLVLAGGALMLVLVLLFSSVRNLSGHTPLSLDEALGLGAPSAEEEQKRSVLRALKDLEYERSVGKISEEDYQEFSARYREDAKRLILRLDERLSTAREIAEKLAEERLSKAALDAEGPTALNDEALPVPPLPDETSSVTAPQDEAQPPQTPLDRGSDPACAACGTLNDWDARFCKRCGGALPETEAPPPEVALQERQEKTP